MFDVFSSTTHLVAVLDAIADGVTVQDQNGRLVYANQKAAETLGFPTPDTLLTASIEEMVRQFLVYDADGRTVSIADFPGRRVLQGAPSVEMLLRFRMLYSKEDRWALVKSNPVYGETGEVLFAVTIFRDVTERIQLEKTLAHARAEAEAATRNLHNLFMEAPALIGILSGREGRVTLFNPQFSRLWGYRPVMGKTMREAWPELEGQGYFEFVEQVYDTGEPAFGNEYPGMIDRHNNGVLEKAFFNFVYQATHDADGSVNGVAIYGVDVTDFVTARQRVEASEARLTMTLEAAQISTWYYDIAQDTVERSLDHDQIFGYDEMQVGWSIDDLLRHVVPEDVETVRRQFDETLQTGKTELECRIRRADNGQLRWIHLRARVIAADASGTPTHTAGIIMDVTERKQIEARMTTLYEITAALSQAVTGEDVAKVIVHQGFPLFDAHLGSVCVLGDDRETLQFLAIKGLPPRLWGDPRFSSTVTPGPLNDAVREGNPVLIENRAEYLARYPNFDVLLEKTGSQATACLPLIVNGRVIGGMGMSFLRPTRMDSSMRAFLEALAHQCAQALERARLYEDEQRALKRLAYLAHAGEVLTASLSYDSTLNNVTDLLVPELADWCAVDVVEGNTTRRVAVAHQNPEQIEFLRALLEEYPADPDNPYGYLAVIRSGKPQLIPVIPDHMLEQIARDERHLRLIRQLKLHSNMCVPMIADGEVLGAITFAHAESGRVYTKDDLAFAEALAQRIALALVNARVYEQEQAARIEAQQANELKLQFLAMISHELRTPLTAIKGFTTTLLAKDVHYDPETQHQFLEIVDAETEKLTELIDQLLDLGRLQAGTLGIKPMPEQIGTILRIALVQLHTVTVEHHLAFYLPADLPPVFADVYRIAQVLVNLVGNAARYSPPGTTITISAQTINDMLHVTVKDEGPGIPPEARARVFEAFWQIKGRQNFSRSAGLGLAICQGLVELHGGSIWVEDTPPPGTSITFTLPLYAG